MANRAEVAERRTKNVGMRAEGRSFSEIAEALGYPTPDSALQDHSQATRSRRVSLEVEVEAARKVWIDRCERMIEPFMNAALDDDHTIFERVAAANMVAKLSEIEAKWLRRDAPAPAAPVQDQEPRVPGSQAPAVAVGHARKKVLDMIAANVEAAA